MRLVITAPAEQDLVAIIDYIALENPVAAEKIYRALMATAERLTRFPELGRPGRLAGSREFSVPSLPYMIVYAASADVITILAVFHGARDLAKAFQDLSIQSKS